MAPLLRPATSADRPFLLRLMTRLADFPVPGWRTREEIAVADQRILLDALERRPDDALILIAEEPPGHPAGYVFATTDTDYFTGRLHAHIEVLAVVPQAEGQGLARALVEAAEQWARGRGYGQITLNVFFRNERARGVYHRLGYEPETVHYRKALGGTREPASGSE